MFFGVIIVIWLTPKYAYSLHFIKMRLFYFVILLFPILALCQNSNSELTLDEDISQYKNKEIIVIVHNWILRNSSSCVRKAISVTTQAVIIDTCYEKSGTEVSPDILQNIIDDDFYLELIKMTEHDLKQLQEDLIGFNDKDECDESAQPVIIIFKENDQKYTYGLPRYLHCFPKKAEHFMVQLENLIKSIP